MAHVGRKFAGSRTLRPHVYRRDVSPAHMRGEFERPMQTGVRRVPPRRPPVPVCPEFRAGLQTRGRSVPARSTARTRGARVYGAPANSAQVCTGGGRRRARGGRVYAGPESSTRVCTRGLGRAAHTRPDIAESCELGAGAYPGLGRACTHPGRHCGIVQARAGRVAPRGPSWRKPGSV